MSLQRVAKFVDSLVGSEAETIVLYHLTSSHRTNQIAAWKKSDVQEIQAVIWESAVAFADALCGTQTFVLKAFVKGDVGRADPVASSAFRASSASREEDVVPLPERVTLTLDELFTLAQRGGPAPTIDSKDGAGFDVAMMEATTKPIVFRVRVKLGDVGSRIVEVLARPATT